MHPQPTWFTVNFYKLIFSISLLVILVSSLINPITQANNQLGLATNSATEESSESTATGSTSNPSLGQAQNNPRLKLLQNKPI